MRSALFAVVLAVLAVLVAPWDGHAQDSGRRDPVQRDLSAYRLRVADVLEVVVYQHPELSRSGIAVPANGEISFPPIGKLSLKDKTVFDVEAEIAERLRAEKFLENPVVTAIVSEYSPRTVYLMGAVQGTVALPTHKNVRILELLAMAGGLSNPSADFSRVTIRRYAPSGEAFPIEVSVTDILERNQEQQNVIVSEGDMIIVPRLELASPQSAEWVYVLGKVRSPGRIAVVRGRTGFTLSKLIAMAGDFQEFAKRSEIVLIRKSDTGRQRIVVDFDKIIEGDRPDIELEADDLIYVPETFF